MLDRALAMLLAASAAFLLASQPAVAKERKNWTAFVSVGEDGTHSLGNPDAAHKLTEFVSYTCSHCATFQKDSDAPLRLAYVMPGAVSVRIVNLIRDPVDLTVAMLTNCGAPDGFFARHHAFLHAQHKWLPRLRTMSDAQRARWTGGDMASRFRAIAADFGFYDIMAHRGFDRSAVDRCLANKKTAQIIVAQAREAEELGVPGTPSFVLDSELLEGVHSWTALDAALKSRMRPGD